MMDYSNGDFSFHVCPFVLVDQGKEMKSRILLSVGVLGVDGHESESVWMEDAVERIMDAMTGGSAGIKGYYEATEGVLDGEGPYLTWTASVHMDRLGLHPDLSRAARKIPGEEPITLFYRFVDGELVDDSSGANESAMGDES